MVFAGEGFLYGVWFGGVFVFFKTLIFVFWICFVFMDLVFLVWLFGIFWLLGFYSFLKLWFWVLVNLFLSFCEYLVFVLGKISA